MPGRIRKSSSTLRKHPYIFATIIATLLAVIVWLCVPREYTAVTKLSDEYKETDLAIGLNKLQARINEANSNKGINDMGTYCQLLKTDDFARSISHKQVPGKYMDYGHWVMRDRYFWQSKDTIETIKDCINYNYSNKQETLIIGFTDSDATIAAQMLDSVTSQLQNLITEDRHKKNQDLIQMYKKRHLSLIKKHKYAQESYTKFYDAHNDPNSQLERQELNYLERNVQLTYEELKKSTENIIRQEALSHRASPSFAIVQPTVVPTKSNAHLIEYVLSFIFVALLLVYWITLYLQRKKTNICSFDLGGSTSPWIITIAVWGGMLILLQFRNPALLNAPKEQFYISLALWLLFFCITSIITYNLMEGGKSVIKDTTSIGIKFSDLNMYAYIFLLFLSIVMTPLYVKKIYDVTLLFGTEDFMYNVRNYAVYGDLNVGILSYSVPINISLLLVSLWGYPRIKLWQVIWACAACILNSLAIMEKGGIFTVFFCVLFVLYERRYIKARTIGVFSIAILLFFFYFNLMRAEDDGDYQKEETLMGFIAMYILSPPVAYGEISQDVIHQFAARTVPTLYYLINKYGTDLYIVYDRLQPFVYVPVATNVYTIFQPFFQDFGYIGVASAATIYGFISGILYRKACNGHAFSKCLYLYLAYILVLQFFQENLFTIGLFIPELMLFTYLCTQESITLSQKENDI